MVVEVTEILILGAGKLLPEKLARVLPCYAFLGEDAVSEQRGEGRWAAAKSVICSSQRQYEGVAVLANDPRSQGHFRGSLGAPLKLVDSITSTFVGCSK